MPAIYEFKRSFVAKLYCLQAFMAVDLFDLLKTALGAGVGSVIAQASLSVWKDKITRRDHAGYLAMRVATILESFAFECAEKVEANQNAQTRPGEQFPDWDISIPTLGDYPADVDGWRYLDRVLADRCLRLPNAIKVSTQTIAFVVDLIDDNLGDHANIEISDRGTDAWKLSRDLRQRFDLRKCGTFRLGFYLLA